MATARLAISADFLRIFQELDSLLAWIACIADAQPVDTYADYLRSAAFGLEKVEVHDEALTEMVQQVRKAE